MSFGGERSHALFIVQIYRASDDFRDVGVVYVNEEEACNVRYNKGWAGGTGHPEDLWVLGPRKHTARQAHARQTHCPRIIHSTRVQVMTCVYVHPYHAQNMHDNTLPAHTRTYPDHAQNVPSYP